LEEISRLELSCLGARHGRVKKRGGFENVVDLERVIAELRGWSAQKEGRVKLLAPSTRFESPPEGCQLSPAPSIARQG